MTKKNGLKVAKERKRKRNLTHVPFGNLVLTRLMNVHARKKGVVPLFAISMTVSSPIMHIWGHLLHTLTQQSSSTSAKKQKGWRFPMNFLSYCVSLCSHLLLCLLIKKEFTIVVDISTRFNANKSIIYNSHRDLSSSPSLIVCVCKNDEKIRILQFVP